MSYFNEVCTKYECSLEYIMGVLYCSDSDFANSMQGALLEKGKVFIGNKKVDDEYIENLSKIAHRYSQSISHEFKTSSQAEDVAQNIILKVASKRGDIFENFSEDVAMKLLRRYMWVAIKNEHINSLGKICYVSTDDESYKSWRTEKNMMFTENVVEEYIQSETTPVSAIQICLQNGMNREEALDYAMRKYNLSEDKLLELMLSEIQKKNKLKYTEDGKIYLGEEME